MATHHSEGKKIEMTQSIDETPSEPMDVHTA